MYDFVCGKFVEIFFYENGKGNLIIIDWFFDFMVVIDYFEFFGEIYICVIEGVEGF